MTDLKNFATGLLRDEQTRGNNALKFLLGYLIIRLMVITLQKSAVSFLMLGLLTFLALAIFGLGHIGGMTANENGDMAGCIFTGKTMLCKMSLIEHISLWKSMFAAMPQRSLMLLVLLVLLSAVVFITKNILAPPRLSKSDALAHNLYFAQHPDLPLFSPLREAFSQGILNPKIYEPAYI